MDIEPNIQWTSQSGQDRFAAVVNKFKMCGTYLELGSGPWYELNNTFALSHNFGWRGVSVERNPFYVSAWRKWRPLDSILEADALLLDYYHLTGGHVDYLSVDIDEGSLAALKRVLDQDVRFNALTFEHDSYRKGPEVRDESRRLLTRAGYVLGAEDVEAPGFGVYEDWWVAP